jgi:predicted XRE-type DNA-binding protein
MSMKNTLVERNSKVLADALGLTEADRAAMEIQFELAERIARVTRRAGMTHAQLARLAGASRPRVTAILNGNLDGVSTDLLLRILAALGVRVRLRFHRAA